MESMEFLLLANSRKSMPKGVNRPGRCIAGVNLATGEFVRLVSDDHGNALDWNIFQNAAPGNVYFVSVHHKAPTIGAQSENWVLGSPILEFLRKEEGTGWIKKYLNNGSGPFGDTFTFYYESSYDQLQESICVITAYNVRVYAEQGSDGRKKIDFDIYFSGPNKRKYRIEKMSMTDPYYHKGPVAVYDSRNGAKRIIDNDNTDVFLGKAYLVVSLPSSPMEGGPRLFNKFVAAIITDDRK